MSKESFLIIHAKQPLSITSACGGAEMATRHLARQLAKRGKRVVVAGVLKEAEQIVDGVEYWDTGKEYSLKRIFERAETLGSYQFISANSAIASRESLSYSMIQSRILILHSQPCSEVGLIPNELNDICDKIIMVSKAQAQKYIDLGTDANKIQVVYNGVDPEIFYDNEISEHNPKHLIFSGALVQDKGLTVLIPAFAKLKETFPDITLSIYGSASLWDREKIFDEASIEQAIPGIKFYGAVPQHVIAEAYRKAGISIFSSIWFECFPLSSLEAQACGCPVVAFDVGGVKEGIIDQKTGLVLNEISQKALEDGLKRLLSNPSQISQMSKNASLRIKEFYTWERVTKEVLDVIDECGKKNQSLKQIKKDTPRVGFVSSWNQVCGLATYAKYLTNQYPENSYIILAERSEQLTTKDENYVHRCWHRDSNSQTEYDLLFNIIQKNQLNVVHFNLHFDFIQSRSNVKFFKPPAINNFLRKLKEHSIKTVVTLHSVFTNDPNLTEFFSLVDQVLVHTPEVRLEAIANNAIPEKVQVIEHGVHVLPELSFSGKKELRQKLNIPTNEKVIVSFGFIQPHKGMEAVLSAVNYLNKQGVNTKGYILGQPNHSDPNSKIYLERLTQACRELNIQNKIHFLTEFLSNSQVSNYLQIADLVIMNYQSQHYEASGACSLALGAGAIVASSLAPVFNAFGPAVWHMTSGYPAELSAWNLITNTNLRHVIDTQRKEYCTKYSWENIGNRIQDIYAELAKEIRLPVTSNKEDTLKILVQNRANALSQPGGDTIVMNHMINELKNLGVEVCLDLETKEDPANYDLVHLFNFATPVITEAQAKHAKSRNTPFVVTTLSEDAPAYRNQAMGWAQIMMAYVENGQNKVWYEQNKDLYKNVQRAEKFDNSWLVDNSVALITNGRNESNTLRRDYGDRAKVFEVHLGFDRVNNPNKNLFKDKYGVTDFVLCVGRLEFRKNQLGLLKALEDSPVTVVLAAGGFSYDQAYVTACKNFKRKGKTIITDRLDNQMLASAYLNAKVHALPSWYELPGLVTLEALHYGCNVVVTNYGTSSDYLGDNAWYCEPGNPESIANAINTALASPHPQNAHKLAEQYSWQAMAKNLVNVYEKVLNKKFLFNTQEEIKVENKNLSNQAQIVPPSTISYDFADGIIEFQEVLERGEMAAKDRQYNIAHDLLSRAIKLNPNSGRALRARGAVFLAENQPISAEQCFRKALTIDAHDPKALSGMGMCAMQNKDYNSAYASFVSALRHDHTAIVTILQLLECSYILNKFDDLVESLRIYLECNPLDLNMQFSLAGALYKQGTHGEARSMCQSILEQDSNHAGAIELMKCLESSTSISNNSLASQVEKTLESKAVSAEEIKIETQLAILEDKKHKKQYSQLLVECNDFIKANSLNAEQKERFDLLVAEVYGLSGDCQSAEEIFNSVLANNPNCARAHSGLGALSAVALQWSVAENYFNEAIRLNAKCDSALAGLGVCASHRNDNNKAWDFYQRALSINCENSRALLGAMEIGYAQGKYADLEPIIRKYLDLHPADKSFVFSLAGCLYQQNKISEAISEVEKLKLIDPQNKDAEQLEVLINRKKVELANSANA